MRISKNCIRGKLIKNAAEIMPLALNGEAIHREGWAHPRAAAFFLSMRFKDVMDMIQHKRLYRVINSKTDRIPLK